jgi:HD domain
VNRLAFLNVAASGAAAPVVGAAGASAGATVAGVQLPDSPLAREALALAQAAGNDALLNHSLRTFLFAELLARHDALAHDAELVFVASIMHDLGLTSGYVSERNRFEVDGALAARDLMRKHGASDASIDTVWDGITLHDAGGLAKWKRAEVRLVNVGVGADFGGGLDALRREDVVAVLAFAPRDGFIDAFLPAVAAVAAKKPFATGSCFVTDVGNRLVPGFHLANFCDEVKDDPFAAYRAGSNINAG